MDTQHEATATIVTAAQGRLVEELRQQGVRVAGAEVTCTPGETGRQSQGQGRGSAPEPAHLIETATPPAEPRAEARAADPRGRSPPSQRVPHGQVHTRTAEGRGG